MGQIFREAGLLVAEMPLSVSEMGVYEGISNHNDFTIQICLQSKLIHESFVDHLEVGGIVEILQGSSPFQEMAHYLLDLQVAHDRNIPIDCLVNEVFVLEVLLAVEELEVH